MANRVTRPTLFVAVQPGESPRDAGWRPSAAVRCAEAFARAMDACTRFWFLCSKFTERG